MNIEEEDTYAVLTPDESQAIVTSDQDGGQTETATQTAEQTPTETESTPTETEPTPTDDGGDQTPTEEETTDEEC